MGRYFLTTLVCLMLITINNTMAAQEKLFFPDSPLIPRKGTVGIGITGVKKESGDITIFDSNGEKKDLTGNRLTSYYELYLNIYHSLSDNFQIGFLIPYINWAEEKDPSERYLIKRRMQGIQDLHISFDLGNQSRNNLPQFLFTAGLEMKLPTADDIMKNPTVNQKNEDITFYPPLGTGQLNLTPNITGKYVFTERLAVGLSFDYTYSFAGKQLVPNDFKLYYDEAELSYEVELSYDEVEFKLGNITILNIYSKIALNKNVGLTLRGMRRNRSKSIEAEVPIPTSEWSETAIIGHLNLLISKGIQLTITGVIPISGNNIPTNKMIMASLNIYRLSGN